MAKVDILSLTWNGADKLQRLRPGLLKNLEYAGVDYHWWIKDNGSTDQTVKIASDWKDTTVLETGHNTDNFAKGVNILVNFVCTGNTHPLIIPIRSRGFTKQLADNDVFLLLNNDVEFPNDDTLSKMLRLMEKTNAAVVGVRLLYQGTNLGQHFGVSFSAKYNSLPYHFRHKEKSDKNTEKNRYFQAVTAAVALVRIKDFIDIGGMNTEFNWAFEDVSMCLTMGEKGKKIVYCGESFAYHEESATLKKNPVNKLFVQQNVALFNKLHQGKYELDWDNYLSDPSYKVIE